MKREKIRETLLEMKKDLQDLQELHDKYCNPPARKKIMVMDGELHSQNNPLQEELNHLKESPVVRKQTMIIVLETLIALKKESDGRLKQPYFI